MKIVRCGMPVLFLLACGPAVAGEILKCVDAEGKVTFSDTACPADAPEQVQARQPAAKQGDATQQGAAKPGEQPRGTYGKYIDQGREFEKSQKPE